MPLSTGEALIGGPTAVTVDLVETFRSALPWMLLALGGAMLVLLTIGFRSIVLPLKAIVMAAISIGASYGVLTWVFQDGHGARLLGFDAPGFIETTTPMIMMAILFELSMDYEVFMLSRMREEWLKTGDNTLLVPATMRLPGRWNWWFPGRAGPAVRRSPEPGQAPARPAHASDSVPGG